MDVSAFPAWEQGEAAELDRENRAYRSWTPRSRWRDIAAVSAEAVKDRPSPWDLEEWDTFGRGAGLRGHALTWFGSLFMWPICVVEGVWVNGRHRARVLERAGAVQVAVDDPEHVPEWARNTPDHA